MTQWGMNPAVVEQISRELDAEAARIEGVLADVRSQVNNATGAWDGRDATRFENSWNSDHQPALRAAVEMMRQMARCAASNAAEQRRISGQ